MSADRHLLLFCAGCGEDRPFEQPPCLDDHGADCPEWACVDCGAAILLGPTPAAAVAAAVTRGTKPAGTTAGPWSQSQRRGSDDPGDGLHRRHVA